MIDFLVTDEKRRKFALDNRDAIFKNNTFLPENVFKIAQKSITIYMFDEIVGPKGSELFLNFSRKFGDNVIWMMSLDPTRSDIGGNSFEWLFEFRSNNLSEQYIKALEYAPLEPAFPDTMQYISRVVCWWGDSGIWGVFGERKYEVCISNTSECEGATYCNYWRGTINDIENILSPIRISRVKKALFVRRMKEVWSPS